MTIWNGWNGSNWNGSNNTFSISGSTATTSVSNTFSIAGTGAGGQYLSSNGLGDVHWTYVPSTTYIPADISYIPLETIVDKSSPTIIPFNYSWPEKDTSEEVKGLKEQIELLKKFAQKLLELRYGDQPKSDS
jgi:hypothetical protein